MSGRVLFTVAVLVVFAAAVLYTALCARAEARDDAAQARREPADGRGVVTDAALAELLAEADVDGAQAA